MTYHFLKSTFITCLFLAALMMLKSSYGQEVCQIVYGTELVKPNDRYISLQGPNLWFSDDGVCWYKKYYPELDKPNNGYPSTIAFFNETDGIIATQDNPNFENSKIFITDDGGDTWIEQAYNFDNDCQSGLFSYRLYVLDDNALLMTQLFSNRFLISKDRGLNWSCIDAYSFNGGQSPDIEVTDNNTWYVATREGISKTIDQGDTHDIIIPGNFDYIEKNASGDQLFAIGHDGVDPVFYWIEDESSITKSIYLNELIPHIGYVGQFVVADDVFYLFTGDVLYSSVDFGDSWKLVDIENVNGLKVSRIENNVYVSRGTHLKLNCESEEICDIATIEDDVIVYPNPTNDNIIFNTINYNTVRIYSIDGKLIEVKTIQNNLINRRSRIDLENLIPGAYIFVLEGEESIISRKVIKI